MYSQHHFSKKGFTVLELLVAVSVTALLAGMLLNITSQVVTTQTQASGNLETNQAAQFVLDRIQEDLQCAIYRNDGNIWMAADVLNATDNSGHWNEKKYKVPKPVKQSLRILPEHWPENALDLQAIANKQGKLTDSRFGIAGTWFRFFTEAPELDPDAENSGGARAISYQILRHGLTSSETSTPRYQLFRSDVSDINTLNSGYNLYGPYSNTSDDGPRESGNIKNPIFKKENGKESTDFSLASNVVDFGIRAYLIRSGKAGTGYLQQIFPDTNSTSDGFQLRSTSNSNYHEDKQKKYLHAFPDVIDVMVRVLTAEGSSALSAYEEGLIPPSEEMNEDEYWWYLVEQNSEVYTRRVRIFSEGI
jgi:prepilin-type N-terminal cleavage/methylation domain-containing protein